MFRYDITGSEIASKAVGEISSLLLPSVHHESQSQSQSQSQTILPLQLVSMKESFDLELLTRFYNDIMIPNFPLEEERDDLEDWIYCLDPVKNNNGSEHQHQSYPSMDVLLLIKHQVQSALPREETPTFSTGSTIVAGVAFEYYKQAECGLLSYMVIPTEFRRLGIMRSIHPVACHAMQLLHQEHASTTNIANVGPAIRAILAETNTPDAGDVSPSVIRKRHESLYRLGYRHLKFPYIQPALADDAKSFDEIILLIYTPSDRHTTTSTTIETEILKQYIVDFFQSVKGYDNEIYKEDWYYQLVEWFSKENRRTDIAQSLPWEDVTEAMKECMAKSTSNNGTLPSASRKQNHVTVIGAGIAGLVSTVTLAEEYLNKQQYEKNYSSDGDIVPLTITLIEAQSFVGGRIRTVVTRDDEVENSESQPLVFSNDRLSDSRKVYGFAPWSVAIGAEFVHGVDSLANDLIENHEEWLVQETFDLCESSEEYPSQNSFVRRRSSITLTKEQRMMPHVEVFMNGTFCPMQDRHGETKSSSEVNRIRKSIQRASNIWQNLQSISQELNSKSDAENGVKYGRDMSLDEFVEYELSDGEENLTGKEVEDVKQLLECVYSNTAGTSNKCLGIHEASREEWNWEYTESNFRLKKCFNEFIEYYLDRVIQINQQSTSLNLGVKIDIELSCPVVEIGSASNGQKQDRKSPKQSAPIRVLTRTEKTFICDKCIVTVPLGVLKAKTVTFKDAYSIPREMQEAIDTINMFSGMKAHMLLKVGIDIHRISKRLKNTELLFCPGEIFSQIWLRRNEESVFVSGFCVANCRDTMMQKVARCGEELKSITAQGLMLDQVQRMFEEGDGIFVNSSQPTCSSFALHDWSEDEFTLGIYSSPSVGAGWGGKSYKESIAGDILPPTHRDHLAKPINNDIWFSGEHANTATCATVQSAMESGARAAKEVYLALE